MANEDKNTENPKLASEYLGALMDDWSEQIEGGDSAIHDEDREKSVKRQELEDDISDMESRRKELSEEAELTGDSETVRQGQYLGQESLKASLELEDLVDKGPLPPEGK